VADWIRKRLTFANVVAAIALFLALGTGAVLASGNRGSSSGKIVGYARVKANGDVIAARSRNIDNANVKQENIAAYCFRHLPFQFKGAQVTIDYGKIGDGRSEQAEFAIGNPYDDCAGSKVEAEVATSNGADFAKEAFFIQFYR
jgi:hypothetical protein